MTKKRFDNRDTPFGRWIRGHQELQSSLGFDFQDFDHVLPNDYFDSEEHKVYISHQFLNGQMMLLEEKRYKSPRTMSQRDTFGILDQWCGAASGMEVKREIEGRPNKVEYWGYYVIQFEKTSPIDGKIWVNGEPATRRDLLELLKFNRRIANHYRTENNNAIQP